MSKQSTPKPQKQQSSESYIGECIAFNESNYVYNIMLFESRIIPAVNSIIKEYSALPMESKIVDKEFLSSLDATGITTFTQQYQEFAEGAIKKLNLPGKTFNSNFFSEIDQDLKPLRIAFDRLTAIRTDLSRNYHSDISLLDIENSQALLSDRGKSELKRLYSIFINSETESDLWTGFMLLKDAFDKQAQRLTAIGYQLHHNLKPLFDNFSGSSLVFQDENNSMQVNTESFNQLKGLIAQMKNGPRQ